MDQTTDATRDAASARPRSLRVFALLTYAALLVNVTGYLRDVQYVGKVTPLFAAASCAFYAAIYLAPVVLLCGAVRLILGRGKGRWRSVCIYGFWVLAASLLQLIVYADQMVYHLYNFHFNGFVWNLIWTPGGLDSLGGGESTDRSTALLALGLLAMQFVFLLIALWLPRVNTWLYRVLSRRKLVWMTALLLAVGGVSQATYGISSMRGYTPVLTAASAFPLFMPITFNRLAQSFGVEVTREKVLHANVEGLRLKYPLASIRRDSTIKPLNIVWLVSESLRADMLDPEIMPNTWKLAQQSTRFTQHYSGGNGTRMGMFAMFYGLYGSYWFPFLAEHRGPVLFDVLTELNYQMEMFTSAKFSYPEFDKTIFAKISSSKLHEIEAEPRWRRDEFHVTNINKFIDERDPARPFMTFMFFESPHAKYFFPEETAIRTPYAKDINYTKLDEEVKTHIVEIKNRYINACHYLDIQLGRVFDHLREKGLMDSTIVIVTGDHGEEFMEKGKWGHNSTFSDEQTRPPLVIWIPGRQPAVVDRLTSHLDLPATVLTALGVQNPASDYSQGFDLFGPTVRDFTVLADWDSVVYLDARFKAVFPTSAYQMAQQKITDRNDKDVVDRNSFYHANRENVVRLMKQLNEFGK